VVDPVVVLFVEAPLPCFLDEEELLLVLVVVVVVDVLVLVVTVALGEPLLDVVHDAVTVLTGPVPEGTICDAGVPAGALTSNVRTCPVSRVTVTLHWSAAAIGMPATAIVPRAEPAAMTRSFSFRRTDTVLSFLPRGCLHSRAATVDPAR
jgi:hypothetical protein